MMGNYFGGGFGFGFGWIFMIIFWGLIIWAIIALIRSFSGGQGIGGRGCGHDHDTHKADSTKSDNSVEILKERYAKGEITKEQFEQMKKDLQ